MTSPTNPFPGKPSARIFELRDKFGVNLSGAILAYLDEQSAAQEATSAPAEEELIAIGGKGKHEYRVRRRDGTWVRVRCDSLHPQDGGGLVGVNVERPGDIEDKYQLLYRTTVVIFAAGSWTDLVPAKSPGDPL